MTSSRTLEENREIANEALARFSSSPLLHLIDGELVPSSTSLTFENVSPMDQMLENQKEFLLDCMMDALLDLMWVS